MKNCRRANASLIDRFKWNFFATKEFLSWFFNRSVKEQFTRFYSSSGIQFTMACTLFSDITILSQFDSDTTNVFLSPNKELSTRHGIIVKL